MKTKLDGLIQGIMVFQARCQGTQLQAAQYSKGEHLAITTDTPLPADIRDHIEALGWEEIAWPINTGSHSPATHGQRCIGGVPATDTHPPAAAVEVWVYRMPLPITADPLEPDQAIGG